MKGILALAIMAFLLAGCIGTSTTPDTAPSGNEAPSDGELDTTPEPEIAPETPTSGIDGFPEEPQDEEPEPFSMEGNPIGIWVPHGPLEIKVDQFYLTDKVSNRPANDNMQILKLPTRVKNNGEEIVQALKSDFKVYGTDGVQRKHINVDVMFAFQENELGKDHMTDGDLYFDIPKEGPYWLVFTKLGYETVIEII